MSVPTKASQTPAPASQTPPAGERAATQRERAARRWDRVRSYGILLAIILLVIFNVFRIHNLIASTETFIERGTVGMEYARALQQAVNVNLTQVATIVIVGVGMTLVVATGGIDLSVGAVMAIAGQVAPLIFLGRIADRFGMTVANILALTVPLVVAGALRPAERPDDHQAPIPAHHRDAGRLYRRARHRAGDDQRLLAAVQEPGLPVHRARPAPGHSDAGLYHVCGRACRSFPGPQDDLRAYMSSPSAATNARPGWPACRSNRVKTLGLRHQRRAGRRRRADRGGDQRGIRREPQRHEHGARRDRRHCRWRHAAHRRPGEHSRNSARRVAHPAGALSR